MTINNRENIFPDPSLRQPKWSDHWSLCASMQSDICDILMNKHGKLTYQFNVSERAAVEGMIRDDYLHVRLIGKLYLMRNFSWSHKDGERLEEIDRLIKNCTLMVDFGTDKTVSDISFSDMLGNMSYEYATGEQTLNIFLDTIMTHVAAKKLQSSDLTDDTERYIYSVLCHEYAHLASLDPIDPSVRRLRIVASDFVRPNPFEVYDPAFVSYRCGYSLSQLRGQYSVDMFRSMNEAITELIGEEIFRLLGEDITGGEYEFSYIEEVQLFKKAMDLYCGEIWQEREEVWRQIKRGYFLWWTDRDEIIGNFLEPYWEWFDAIIFEKKEQKRRNHIRILNARGSDFLT